VAVGKAPVITRIGVGRRSPAGRGGLEEPVDLLGLPDVALVVSVTYMVRTDESLTAAECDKRGV
jgi:hypothetical protein